jgi:hypothetical protein
VNPIQINGIVEMDNPTQMSISGSFNSSAALSANLVGFGVSASNVNGDMTGDSVTINGGFGAFSGSVKIGESGEFQTQGSLNLNIGPKLSLGISVDNVPRC